MVDDLIKIEAYLGFVTTTHHT